MKVLDANFLIDYLDGEPAAKALYDEHGADEAVWIVPSPAFAEVLVGIGNHPSGDVDTVISALSWTDVYEVEETLSITAARIADEIGPQGPYLDGVDALVAAVGRTLDAPVVSTDGDLTHERTRAVVDVEPYETRNRCPESRSDGSRSRSRTPCREEPGSFLPRGNGRPPHTTRLRRC